MNPTLSPTPTALGLEPNSGRLWWVFLLFGLTSILVGVAALSAAFIATMASVVFFGVLLVIAGVGDVVHAVVRMVRREGGAVQLLTGGLYLLAGVFMLEDPVRAATVLTLLIAAAFLIGGLLRIVVAAVERFPSWPWVLLTGVIDLVLGSLIAADWPESGLWVIGLFLGIDLVFHGLSWVILALSVRTLTTRPAVAS
jgi:uncharacterized membrane protein HdeD (DUF308 family)